MDDTTALAPEGGREQAAAWHSLSAATAVLVVVEIDKALRRRRISQKVEV